MKIKDKKRKLPLTRLEAYALATCVVACAKSGNVPEGMAELLLPVCDRLTKRFGIFVNEQEFPYLGEE